MIDSKSYYDRFSKHYDDKRHFGYHAFLDESEFSSIKELVANKYVLEVGCGSGLIMNRIARVANRVIGIDLSSGMLLKAQSRGHIVLQSDAKALPFKDETFDVAVAFKVLPHIVHVRQTIREMMRVTKTHGYLALEFYNPLSIRGIIKKLKPPTYIEKDVSDKDVFTRHDSLEDIFGMLPKGLNVVEIRGVRVLLPFAFIGDLPLLGSMIWKIERFLSVSPLFRYAGFLIVIARKEEI